ncbi:toxin-activating lysine-acyltransferase, partial [Neisseria meningitidis]|nr:toxin-activating lysine-acyltransferase [Neisseria meningitidis]MBH2061633.1 toxin-activating lysine-acyltransferase [Neisseria meningitidis]MBH2081931.1 toxin-activating lysine-acyltransferase [Neisseria meningitidis]MBH5897336.1 toxin-activating lysine-acyltransferase [Neisseria meningitidis]
WFAPLGHSHQMRSAVRQLFPSTTLRALYHKGSDKGLRILTFKT